MCSGAAKPASGEMTKRDFALVEEPVEYRRLMKEAAANNASAFIWTRNQEHSLRSKMTAYLESDSCVYFWTPGDFDPMIFGQELAAKGITECYISLSLAKA